MTDAPLASGIEIDQLDPAARPQDDLFRHVNGRWLDATEIPADKARWGTFYVLAEEAEAAVRAIIEEAQGAEPGTVERKVGDLFASFMDEERVESLGTAPLAPLLAEVDAIDTVEALLPAIGRLERGGVGGFFRAYVDNDPGDPERYIVTLLQGGLGLPDEAYYREEKHGELRAQYLEAIARILELAGLDDAGTRAGRILGLETALAAHHWNNVDSRDSSKTYNLRSWAELRELAPGVDLDGWRDGMGVPAGAFDEVVLAQPSFAEALPGLIAPEQLEAWRDWLRWNVIRSLAPYLSGAIVEANFEFYGRALQGVPEMRARWKRGVSLVEGSLGEAVGRVYVERHFPESAKTAMDELVDNLIEAYRQSIRGLDWMTPATQERALEKLEKFTPKIGYPVRWRDYSALEIDPADLVANVQATTEFEFQRELGKIGRPIDRDEWFMTPQTINAYYNPGFNEIVFPAAILQYPFFDEGRDAAANYGAIGAVIGHEIGHGFDDNGSRFDGDGRLADWWTAEDREAFEARTRVLIEQYDALSPRDIPDATVPGELTIGENIGDLGGLGIAWKAWQLSLDGAEPPVIDGLTGAERFFLSWAQAWRAKYRPAEARRLIAIDPHAPNEFRCNQIVRNIDAYYSTFGVTPQDALWLPPTDRVTIW
ncbi:M13 family metallopeptidase [Homoserinibacter sp. YIM 151385]|uniref:M13 family metallopeptidase n=1 Tax=Homoserinibacter sp. YIM 151385 TaxID=2985506 RepID=UPI0022F0B5D0|nr:M13-type metalloendopeptidase [Homoserinibacter sp. YIM 151385]WBU37188.1 peptidase M13 [Homoserinibacter sp. YIM 151385]